MGRVKAGDLIHPKKDRQRHTKYQRYEVQEVSRVTTNRWGQKVYRCLETDYDHKAINWEKCIQMRFDLKTKE